MTGRKLLLWLTGILLAATVILLLNYQWLTKTLVNQALEPHQIQIQQLDFKLTDSDTIAVDRLQLENRGNQLTLTGLQLELPVPFYQFSMEQVGKTQVKLQRLDLNLIRLPPALLPRKSITPGTAPGSQSEPLPPLPSIQLRQAQLNLAGLPLRIGNISFENVGLGNISFEEVGLNSSPADTGEDKAQRSAANSIRFAGDLYPAYLSNSQQAPQQPLIQLTGELSRSAVHLDAQSPLGLWNQTLQQLEEHPLLTALIPAQTREILEAISQLQLEGNAHLDLDYQFDGQLLLTGKVRSLSVSAPLNTLVAKFSGTGTTKDIVGEENKPSATPDTRENAEVISLGSDSIEFSLSSSSQDSARGKGTSITLSPGSLKLNNAFALLPQSDNWLAVTNKLELNNSSELQLAWQQPIQVSHAVVEDNRTNTFLRVQSPGELRLSAGKQALSLRQTELSCAQGCSVSSDWYTKLQFQELNWPLHSIAGNSAKNKSTQPPAHLSQSSTSHLNASQLNQWSIKQGKLKGEGKLTAAFSPEKSSQKQADAPQPASSQLLLSASLQLDANQLDGEMAENQQRLSLTSPSMKAELSLGMNGDKLSLHKPQFALSTQGFRFISLNRELSGVAELSASGEQLALWQPLDKQAPQAMSLDISARELKLNQQGELWNLPLTSLKQSLQWQPTATGQTGQMTTSETWQIGALPVTSHHQLVNMGQQNWRLTGQWQNQSLLPTLEQLLASTLPAEMWKQYRPRELSLSGMLETQVSGQANLALPILSRPLLGDDKIEPQARKMQLGQWQLKLAPRLSLVKASKGAVSAENGKVSAVCQLSSDSNSVNCQQLAVTLETFNPGLPINDITLDGQMDIDTLGDGGELNIKGGGELLGGEFLLPQFNLSRNDTSHAYLVLQGLSLPQLLALQPLEGVTATGIFDGVLPAKIEKGKISVSGGRLAARAPGGLIAVTDNPTVLSLRQSQPHLDFAFNALEHLEYNTLASTFDMQPGGEAELKVQVKGRSPGIERPIEFNYNHEENLLQLLQSLQIGNTLQQQLQDSLE
ncbi:YdbH domain-containing protein [Shewanella submarina]|uniref:YdbH domain-containing protein n=1 Tax=Shewanella submarina TaxID=2016376 RepID=A0ABV7GGQ7_9GAMM|nr:YdbH domain-containing protein [Shewanella submarina]MCL1039729.1 YdbH domain-containing protein [Shewanella submarina]